MDWTTVCRPTERRETGASHPDRNAQFGTSARKSVRSKHSNSRSYQSPSCRLRKRSELVGDFRNVGLEWQPQGSPDKVRVHDFKDKELGKAIPYGIYDITNNEGWVSVGIDHDTAQFATATLKRWWHKMGSRVYRKATRLLITADAGGSNRVEKSRWKVALQELADDIGLSVSVCHFPPGTSKWNKIEHRMFCHITQNWRGKPLVSQAVIVNLIGNTTTRTGLRVRAALDASSYEAGIKVRDEELAAVRIRQDKFHGDWNYTISPR